jgi:hypothetical protein
MQSGVYSCGGLSGKYIGIFRDGNKRLGICQIRAYSWAPNLLPVNVTSSLASTGVKENLLSFSTKITDPSFNPFVTTESPAYWKLAFGGTELRFIQAVTIVGQAQDDFANTQDWLLTIIDANSAEVPVYTSTPLDRYGKEIVVQQFGKGVILKKQSFPFGLAYVAVFTTMTDCRLAAQFVWNSEPASEPAPVVVSVQAEATVQLLASVNAGDCPLAHTLTMADSTSVPDFLSFETITGTITIKPTLVTHVGIYFLKVTAVLNDGSTAIQTSSKSFTVEVFACTSLTIVPATSFAEKKLYISSNPSQQSFDLPSFLPTPAASII